MLALIRSRPTGKGVLENIDEPLNPKFDNPTLIGVSFALASFRLLSTLTSHRISLSNVSYAKLGKYGVCLKSVCFYLTSTLVNRLSKSDPTCEFNLKHSIFWPY